MFVGVLILVRAVLAIPWDVPWAVPRIPWASFETSNEKYRNVGQPVTIAVTQDGNLSLACLSLGKR